MVLCHSQWSFGTFWLHVTANPFQTGISRKGIKHNVTFKLLFFFFLNRHLQVSDLDSLEIY